MPGQLVEYLKYVHEELKSKTHYPTLFLWLVVLPWWIATHAGEYPYSPLKASVSSTIFGCSLILFFLVSSFCIFFHQVSLISNKKSFQSLYSWQFHFKWPFSLFSLVFLYIFVLFSSYFFIFFDDLTHYCRRHSWSHHWRRWSRHSGCQQIRCRRSSRHSGMKEILRFSFMMSCSFNGKTSNQGLLALCPSPTWVKGLQLKAATPGSVVPESSSCWS